MWTNLQWAFYEYYISMVGPYPSGAEESKNKSFLLLEHQCNDNEKSFNINYRMALTLNPNLTTFVQCSP
jgi:hypothetical protein